MFPRRWARLAGALAVSLAACTPAAVTSSPTVTATAPPILPSTLAPPSPTPAPTILALWVPPFLSVDTGTASGALLAERLQAFESAHPGVKLAVRTKDSGGPSGLLETLRAASVVAPASRPDLIALGPGELSAAAHEGLIASYPGSLPAPAEADWYDFALSSSTLDATRYGVPSAGQAEILVYDTAAYRRPPSDWSDLVGGPAPFLFPAADPLAGFTLAEYLAAGGSLAQANGSPALDPAVLEEVLTFFGSAYSAGVLPLTSRQYTSASQTAQAFDQRRAASAVSPLESWMANPRSDAGAGPLPTRDGTGVAFARAWSWSVVTQDAQKQALAVDLVEWLSDPAFLGPWTYALGALPPNAAALDVWPGRPATVLVNHLVQVAVPPPSREVADVVTPALLKAVDAVLTGALTPQAAALQAATEVAGP